MVDTCALVLLGISGWLLRLHHVEASYRVLFMYNTATCEKVPGGIPYLGVFKTNTQCSTVMSSNFNLCTSSAQFPGYAQRVECLGNDQDPLTYLSTYELLRDEQWVTTKNFLDSNCSNNVVSPKKTFLSAWNLATKCQIPFTNEFVGFKTFELQPNGSVLETIFDASDATCTGPAQSSRTLDANSGVCANNAQAFVVQPSDAIANDSTFALTLAFDNVDCKGAPRSVSGTAKKTADCSASFESSACVAQSSSTWTKTHCTQDPDRYVATTFANSTSFMVRQHFEDAFCTQVPALWESFVADSKCSVVLSDGSSLTAGIASDGSITANLYNNAVCSGKPSQTQVLQDFSVNRNVCVNRVQYSSLYHKTPGYAVWVAYGKAGCHEKSTGYFSKWKDDCKNETQVQNCEQLQVDGETRQVWVTSYCAASEDEAINATFPEVNHLKVLLFTDETCGTYIGVSVFPTQDNCGVLPMRGMGFTIRMDPDNDLVYATSFTSENCSTTDKIRDYLVPASGLCVSVHRFYHVKKQPDFGLTLLYSNRACVGTPRAFFGAPRENCTDHMKRSSCEAFPGGDTSSYWSLAHCTDDPVTFAKKVFVNRNFSLTMRYTDGSSQCDSQQGGSPVVLGSVADGGCVLNATDRTGYTATVDDGGDVRLTLFSNSTCQGVAVGTTVLSGANMIKLNDAVVHRDSCVQGVKQFSFAQPLTTQTVIDIPTAAPKRTPAASETSSLTGKNAAVCLGAASAWTWMAVLIVGTLMTNDGA